MKKGKKKEKKEKTWKENENEKIDEKKRAQWGRRPKKMIYIRATVGNREAIEAKKKRFGAFEKKIKKNKKRQKQRGK